jgi:natural product precursor
MKKLGKLKLNALNEQDLAEKQMNALRGGGNCFCSCYWYGQGGSSSSDNRNANLAISDMRDGTKIYSTQGCNSYWGGGCGYADCLNCDESNDGATSGWA